jgi:hypothetical protein
MGLIHRNDCHCHCSKGEHCVPDMPSLPDVPSFLPDASDFSHFKVECGPVQQIFDKVARRHRNDESMDWFEPFEDLCTITELPYATDTEDQGSMGPQ